MSLQSASNSPENQPEPKFAFSTITIHDCVLENGDSVPVVVEASPSFPARRYTDDYTDPPPPTVKTWAARPILLDGSSLDVSLMGLIGEGRIGMTYSARINSARDATGLDVTDSVPQEICLKFAKPPYVRSLAREAWFYEQLHKWQGISTAKCFGFFSATPVGTLVESLLPWKESKKVPRRRRYHPDDDTEYQLPMKDYLPDEAPDPLGLYSDEHGFHHDSPWKTWEHSAESPLLAVLALEKLGGHYFMPDKEPPQRVKGLRHVFQRSTTLLHLLISWFFGFIRKSLRAMVDDITQEGVYHNDITAFNILGVPEESRTLCPRHNCRHKWRLVDFDRADKIDPANCGPWELERAATQVDCIGELWRGFWGTVEE
ncbi:hypothetical protein DXG03_007192 [Asterophora parasitica]|uniref:Uncharacterized protein n=1 Tax=Asterophora parasitica TaxID=117018 RepID=A0A9P7FYA8_9AGAR|nr:hypothetical protein DXG03_007192 [Asterophora parasitica]